MTQYGLVELHAVVETKEGEDPVVPPLPDDPPGDDPMDDPNDTTDQIDPFTQVRWRHHNVSSYPITTDLTVSFDRHRIRLDYDAQWPVFHLNGETAVVANAWVFVQRGDRWVAATWEYLRPGQKKKDKEYVEGGHTKIKDLPRDWRPERGEVLGFMVSTLARHHIEKRVQERSNIVLVRWP